MSAQICLLRRLRSGASNQALRSSSSFGLTHQPGQDEG